MNGTRSVALRQQSHSDRAEQARRHLIDALEDPGVEPPDENGVFTVEVAADSQEDALTQVWNAIASAGADDHIVLMEHPDLPEHWKHATGGPRT